MGTRKLTHVAFIMDGNRRWARAHPESSVYDSSAAHAVFQAIAACQKHDVSSVSLYAFSLENAEARDSFLKRQLFDTLIRVCSQEKEAFISRGVRVRFVGARELYPPHVMKAVQELEVATSAQTVIELSILFFYGAQQEIVHAAKALAQQVAAGVLLPDEISAEHFVAQLWTAGTPPPDLIIRTGGAARLSNFLLYQAAYSELIFLDCLWPDLTEELVHESIEKFYATTINYGA